MAAVPAENGDTRPEQRLAHRLTLQEVDEFLSRFAALIELVELHFRWRPHSPGTNDEMVLEAAVNGHADAHCDV